MLNVISTFYISKYNSYLDKDRSKELDDCLIKNLKNPIVDKIHLFVDDKDALRRLDEISNNSEKIFIISIGLKPKYNDFFNYIIENIQNFKEQLKRIIFSKNCSAPKENLEGGELGISITIDSFPKHCHEFILNKPKEN